MATDKLVHHRILLIKALHARMKSRPRKRTTQSLTTTLVTACAELIILQSVAGSVEIYHIHAFPVSIMEI